MNTHREKTGWAEEIGCAIRDSFKETGHPCDLNLKQGSAMGDWRERGVTRLGEAGEGLITRWSGAHVGSAFTLRELAVQNKLQCHCLPQGVIVNLWREIAAGRSGLDKALSGDYDIILMDLMLPLKTGEEVLRKLRLVKSTPVIIISAKLEVYNRIELFKIGADDYITKPFDIDEVMLRIQAVLRRTKAQTL